MKKLIMLFVIILTSFLTLQTTNAQIRLRVNIGVQPLWGLVGYDYVDNYYLPDIETYYNVNTQYYTYMEGGIWVSRRTLPVRYRNYDMYHTRRIVVNGANPYLRNNEYRNRYSNDRSNRGESIRDSRNGKYFQNVNHPQHSQYNQYIRSQGNNNQKVQINNQRNQRNDQRGNQKNNKR